MHLHPLKTQISLGIDFSHENSKDWSVWVDYQTDLGVQWVKDCQFGVSPVNYAEAEIAQFVCSFMAAHL